LRTRKPNISLFLNPKIEAEPNEAAEPHVFQLLASSSYCGSSAKPWRGFDSLSRLGNIGMRVIISDLAPYLNAAFNTASSKPLARQPQRISDRLKNSPGVMSS
jgi:hypothetical protein